MHVSSLSENSVQSQISKLVAFLIACIFITGCTSLRKDESAKPELKLSRIWSLSTKYTDKRKGKKFPGITKIVIEEDDKLRLDIYGPLGFVHVGTLIINNGQLFIKTMSGETFEGEATAEDVAKVLKVPVEPMDIFGLFLQKGFRDKIWMCTKDQSGSLRECEHPAHQVLVQWSGDMTQTGTRLDLDHPRAKVRFKVKSYTEKSGIDPALFSF